jgi:hypothetical protein
MNITLTNIKPILNEIKQELQKMYGDRLVKLILFGDRDQNLR